MGIGHIVEILAALGGDDDHAISTAGSVDSCCRTILEHVHGSDFIAGDIVDVADGNAIHDIKRRSTRTLVEGGETADLDVVAGLGRIGSGFDDVQAGHFALEETHGVGLYAGVEIFALDGSHATGDFFLLLGTITDDHDLFEESGVLGKIDGCRDLGGLESKSGITDATHFHYGVGAGDRELEITVQAGGDAGGSPLLENGCSVHGTERIHHDALDLIALGI